MPLIHGRLCAPLHGVGSAPGGRENVKAAQYKRCRPPLLRVVQGGEEWGCLWQLVPEARPRPARLRQFHVCSQAARGMFTAGTVPVARAVPRTVTMDANVMGHQFSLCGLLRLLHYSADSP